MFYLESVHQNIPGIYCKKDELTEYKFDLLYL